MTPILHRASISRPSGHWSEADYDVFADGERVVAHLPRPAKRARIDIVDVDGRVPAAARGRRGKHIQCSARSTPSHLAAIEKHPGNCGYCRVGFKSMNRSAVQKPLADFINVLTFPGSLPPNQNYGRKKGANRH
jgi:hypothetical protein